MQHRLRRRSAYLLSLIAFGLIGLIGWTAARRHPQVSAPEPSSGSDVATRGTPEQQADPRENLTEPVSRTAERSERTAESLQDPARNDEELDVLSKTIVGTVLSAEMHSPIAGAVVHVWEFNDRERAHSTTTTDEYGVFSLPGRSNANPQCIEVSSEQRATRLFVYSPGNFPGRQIFAGTILLGPGVVIEGLVDDAAIVSAGETPQFAIFTGSDGSQSVAFDLPVDYDATTGQFRARQPVTVSLDDHVIAISSAGIALAPASRETAEGASSGPLRLRSLPLWTAEFLVVDSAGEPVPNAQLVVVPRFYPLAGFPRSSSRMQCAGEALTARFRATTSGSGRASMELPTLDGKCIVVAEATGQGSARRFWDANEQGEGPVRIAFKVRANKQVRGLVVDEHAFPIPDVQVQVQSGSRELTQTDDLGLFELEFESRRDPVELTLAAKGYGTTRIRIALDQLTNFQTITLRPGEPVSGVVAEESGKPVEGVSITLFVPKTDGSTYQRVSDADGRFSFLDIPKGEYSLSLRGPQGFPVYHDSDNYSVVSNTTDLMLTRTKYRQSDFTHALISAIEYESGQPVHVERCVVMSLSNQEASQGAPRGSSVELDGENVRVSHLTAGTWRAWLRGSGDLYGFTDFAVTDLLEEVSATALVGPLRSSSLTIRIGGEPATGFASDLKSQFIGTASTTPSVRAGWPEFVPPAIGLIDRDIVNIEGLLSTAAYRFEVRGKGFRGYGDLEVGESNTQCTVNCEAQCGIRFIFDGSLEHEWILLAYTDSSGKGIVHGGAAINSKLLGEGHEQFIPMREGVCSWEVYGAPDGTKTLPDDSCRLLVKGAATLTADSPDEIVRVPGD